MKSILFLGSVFLIMISSQIYLELRNTVSPEETDTEMDSLNTRYKIENGKLYFLSTDGTWINQDDFVWQSGNGSFYLQKEDAVYQSNDNTFWRHLSVDKIYQENIPGNQSNRQ